MEHIPKKMWVFAMYSIKSVCDEFELKYTLYRLWADSDVISIYVNKKKMAHNLSDWRRWNIGIFW